MAKGTEEEGEFEVTKYNPHFDELLETHNTLLEDSREVLEKYGELKVSHSKVLKAFNSMKLEKEALEEKNKSMPTLIVENRKLKDTIDKLNYDLGQFVKGEENLSLILGSQRNPNDKSGLGFEAESSRTKKNKEVIVEVNILTHTAEVELSTIQFMTNVFIYHQHKKKPKEELDIEDDSLCWRPNSDRFRFLTTQVFILIGLNAASTKAPSFAAIGGASAAVTKDTRSVNFWQRNFCRARNVSLGVSILVALTVNEVFCFG
ncbi:protein CROWDED NUCLEI 4-like [Senna tora]|uniref:Protein CROWDED NUCLEI 4-like n=1 Tax=Senna tora TaxID=362788 RepID=A0A834WW63_9FABA|nr:protein CROWDED NUCLEI 4-like [Senna tora]